MAPNQTLRVFYAAGAGDVTTTYEHWLAGAVDPSPLHVTYSRQFFDVCRTTRTAAYVL
jgi:hypothetical protein